MLFPYVQTEALVLRLKLRLERANAICCHHAGAYAHYSFPPNTRLPPAAAALILGESGESAPMSLGGIKLTPMFVSVWHMPCTVGFSFKRFVTAVA